MNSQWSEDLRARMDAHQEPSPEGLWESIEQAMAEEPVVIQVKGRVRLLQSVYIGAAAAAIVVALFLGGRMLQPVGTDLRAVQTRGNEKSLSDQPVNSGDATAVQPVDFLENTVLNGATSNTASRVLVGRVSGTKAVHTMFVKSGEEASVQGLFTDAGGEAAVDSNSADSVFSGEKKVATAEHHQGKDKPVSCSRSGQQYKQRNQSVVSPVHTNRAGWEAGLYASNYTSSSKNEHEGYGSLVETENPEYDPEDESHANDEAYKTILFENKQRDVSTRLHHKQPVTVGFSLNYRLNNRLSIGSGLSWIQLNSDVRTGSDKYYFTTDQTLVNLGIPVNINYTVFESSRWSLYLSEGGQVEKTLSAKLVEQSVVDGVPEPEVITHFSNKALQWSLNSAVGLQYRFNNRLGVYAEPGLSYYFDNGGSVETVYKDKPLNFSFRMGLRWSFGL